MSQTTTISTTQPARVTRTAEVDEATQERPQKVFAQKKTIFRFYQVIWYLLSIVEALLGFRILLKALGANPFNGFTAFVYGVTDPLAIPFQGILAPTGNASNVIEWSTIIAAVVYFLIAYGLVVFLQFVKPVSKEEVEETVDEV